MTMSMPTVSVTHIEGAQGTVCAHRSNDVPVCWGGLPVNTIIGDDEPAADGRLDPPMLPFEQLEAVGVACGLYEGDVYCWGRAGVPGAVLGYGRGELEVSFEVALERGGLDIGDMVVAIDSGASLSNTSRVCALAESGNVYCWGSGWGLLGYPGVEFVGDDETPAQMGPVAVGGPVVGIDVGGVGTCALLEDGGLRCWGGLVGPELIGDDESPEDGPLLDLGAPISAVSVGDRHACAIVSDGVVKCWGTDPHGALGQPGVSVAEPSPSLAPIELGGPAVEIVAHVESTCARLEDGKIMCWGSGQYGKLGHPWVPGCELAGSTVHSCSVDPSCCIGDDETPLSVGPVDLGEPARDLVGLSAATCVLTDGGAVRCWGGGYFGALGDGAQPSCLDPDFGLACSVDPRCCIGDDETPAASDRIVVLD